MNQEGTPTGIDVCIGCRYLRTNVSNPHRQSNMRKCLIDLFKGTKEMSHECCGIHVLGSPNELGRLNMNIQRLNLALIALVTAQTPENSSCGLPRPHRRNLSTDALPQ